MMGKCANFHKNISTFIRGIWGIRGMLRRLWDRCVIICLLDDWNFARSVCVAQRNVHYVFASHQRSGLGPAGRLALSWDYSQVSWTTSNAMKCSRRWQWSHNHLLFFQPSVFLQYDDYRRRPIVIDQSSQLAWRVKITFFWLYKYIPAIIFSLETKELVLESTRHLSGTRNWSGATESTRHQIVSFSLENKPHMKK